MRNFPWRETAYAFSFLTLLLALYVGAYFALVRQPASWDTLGPASDDPVASIPQEYRVGGAMDIFEPVHFLDRHWLRKDYWTATLIQGR